MIAHRLETAVEFSDKVLVLDKGQVVQYDQAMTLLANDVSVDKEVTREDSLFADMVRSLTADQQRIIVKKAKNNYK